MPIRITCRAKRTDHWKCFESQGIKSSFLRSVWRYLLWTETRNSASNADQSNYCWANMKILFLSILIFFSIVVSDVEAEGSCATEQCLEAAKIYELPDDVDSFVQLRDGCDYFRSEPWPEGDDPDSKDRRQFILQNLKETCTGTDRQLRELRNKYRNNQIVSEFLKGYEDHIEQR